MICETRKNWKNAWKQVRDNWEVSGEKPENLQLSSTFNMFYSWVYWRSSSSSASAPWLWCASHMLNIHFCFTLSYCLQRWHFKAQGREQSPPERSFKCLLDLFGLCTCKAGQLRTPEQNFWLYLVEKRQTSWHLRHLGGLVCYSLVATTVLQIIQATRVAWPSNVRSFSLITFWKQVVHTSKHACCDVENARISNDCARQDGWDA